MSRFMAECQHCGELFDNEDAWFEHERLQAEAERLQADRAADKARIAELEAALGDLLAIVSDSTGVAGYHLNGAVAEWGEFDEVGAAFAALSQQGKEGET